MSRELESAISNTREWIQDMLRSDPNSEEVLVRRGYLAELYAFSDWRADRSLSKETIDEYFQLLQRSGYSPVSVKRALSAIEWWLDRILELGSKDGVPVQSIEEIRSLNSSLRSASGPKASPPRNRNRISKAQLLNAMQVCSRDATPRGLRDAALVALLIATDISYRSLARLTIYNIRSTSPNGCAIAIKQQDKHEVIIDLPATASDSVSNWLNLRGKGLGPLFYEIKGTREVLWGSAMTEKTVRKVLRSRLEEKTSYDDSSSPLATPLEPSPIDNARLEEPSAPETNTDS